MVLMYNVCEFLRDKCYKSKYIGEDRKHWKMRNDKKEIEVVLLLRIKIASVPEGLFLTENTL